MKNGDFDGILYIPKNNQTVNRPIQVEYYAKEQLGIGTQSVVENIFGDHIQKLKLKTLALDPKQVSKGKINLVPKNLDPQKSEEDVSKYRVYVATFLGGAMMFLIYFVIFIYGQMVMRSVMEEKTNRIVEIIISSVKPFQLMLGKIVGVGAVGLTQFAVWALVFPLLYLGIGLAFSDKLQQMQSGSISGTSEAIDPNTVALVMQELSTFNYSAIVFYFILFFLLGYILYASLFAAVGAAMGDDWGEGQSLTLIITIPIIIAFYLGLAAIENPNSSLAVWSSMFPLFAPILMPTRIVFDPPVWQIILSLILTSACCLFFVWISARIYRVGILMYGKKRL